MFCVYCPKCPNTSFYMFPANFQSFYKLILYAGRLAVPFVTGATFQQSFSLTRYVIPYWISWGSDFNWPPASKHRITHKLSQLCNNQELSFDQYIYFASGQLQSHLGTTATAAGNDGSQVALWRHTHGKITSKYWIFIVMQNPQANFHPLNWIKANLK